MSELFQKYEIEKTDGTPVDPEAMYFVLRVDTDPAARTALATYIKCIQASDPEFAASLKAYAYAGYLKDNALRRTLQTRPPETPA